MMYKKQNTLFFYIEGFDKLYPSLSKHNVYFLNIISNKGEENSSSRKKSLRFDSGSAHLSIFVQTNCGSEKN